MRILSEAWPGERIQVGTILDEEIRIQALRFGIGSGAELQIEQVIPRGPLIVRRGHQLIAINRELAERIEVRKL